MSATSWSCRECTFRNKPGAANCEMCNNPRFRNNNNNNNASANAGGFASSAGPTGTAADFRPTTAAATTDMPFSMALDNPAPSRPPTVTSAPVAAPVSSVAASYPGRVATHYSTTTTATTSSGGAGGGDRAKIEALLEEQGAYVTVKNHPHRLHHVTSIKAWYCDFCRRQCNDWNVRYRSTNDKDKDSCDTCFNAGKAKDDHGQPFKLVSFTRDFARQKVSWYCDECGKANNGFRYRCDINKDYDMCKDCVRKNIVLDGQSSSSSGHSTSGGGGGNVNVFASATASPPIVPVAAVPSPAAGQPYVPSATPAPYVPSAASAQPYVPSAASAQPYVPSATPAPYVPSAASAQPYVPSAASAPSAPYVPSAPSAPYVPSAASAQPYVPGRQPTQPYVPSSSSAPYVATATTTPPPGTYVTATATVVPSPYVPGSGGGNAPYVPTVMASTTPPPGGVYVPPSGGAPYVPTATASTAPPPGGVYVPSSAPSPYVPGRRNP